MDGTVQPSSYATTEPTTKAPGGQFVASATLDGPVHGQAGGLVQGNQGSSYAVRAAFEVDGSSQSTGGGPSVACLKEYSHADL